MAAVEIAAGVRETIEGLEQTCKSADEKAFVTEELATIANIYLIELPDVLVAALSEVLPAWPGPRSDRSDGARRSASRRTLACDDKRTTMTRNLATRLARDGADVVGGQLFVAHPGVGVVRDQHRSDLLARDAGRRHFLVVGAHVVEGELAVLGFALDVLGR